MRQVALELTIEADTVLNQHKQQKYSELEHAWGELSARMEKLYSSLVTETRSDERTRLRHEIGELNELRDDIDHQLKKLLTNGIKIIGGDV